MSSLAKRLRKQAKKRVENISQSAKEVGRNVSRVAAPIVKYGSPVLVAAANAFLGPAAGAAVTVGTGALNRYVGATAARDKGLTGRAARAKGRSAAEFALKTGAAVTAATAALNIVAGGGIGQSGISSVSKLLGIGGGSPTAALSQADALDQQAIAMKQVNPGLAQSLHAQATNIRQGSGGGVGLSEVATIAGKFFGYGALPTDGQTPPINPNGNRGLPTNDNGLGDGGFNSFSGAKDPISTKDKPPADDEGSGAALLLVVLAIAASKKGRR